MYIDLYLPRSLEDIWGPPTPQVGFFRLLPVYLLVVGLTLAAVVLGGDRLIGHPTLVSYPSMLIGCIAAALARVGLSHRAAASTSVATDKLRRELSDAVRKTTHDRALEMCRSIPAVG